MRDEYMPRMSFAKMPSFSSQMSMVRPITQLRINGEQESIHSRASYGSTPVVSSTSSRQSSRHLHTRKRNIYKVDCFSFGMLLWAMMSWKLPFK